MGRISQENGPTPRVFGGSGRKPCKNAGQNTPPKNHFPPQAFCQIRVVWTDMAVEFGVGLGKAGRYGQNLAVEWPNSQGFWGVWFRLFVKSGWYGQIWQWNLEWVLANQGGMGRICPENGPIPRVFWGSGSGFLSNGSLIC